MRGAIGRRLSNPNNGFGLASIAKQTPLLIQPTSHFSSSSDGAGRGRGRGVDGGFTSAGRGKFGVNREQERANEPVGQGRGSSESQSPGGYGHGRGRPIQSDPITPAFSSFVRPVAPSTGRGRGSVGSDPVSPFAAEPPRHSSPPQPQQPHSPSLLKTPVFAKLQDIKETISSPLPPRESKSGQPAPSNNIFNAIGSEFSHPNQASGAGRGKPFVESAPPHNGENRHIRRPQPPPQQQHQRPQPQWQQQHQLPQPQRQQRFQPPKNETPRPQLNPEEAGRRARSQLSLGEAEGGGGGRGGRGRGRGRGARGRGRGRGGVGWRGDEKKEEEAEQEALSRFVGDSADGEKFAKKMGPEIMTQLAEGYEDICERALPSTAHEALVDAYDTNLMVKLLYF